MMSGKPYYVLEIKSQKEYNQLIKSLAIAKGVLQEGISSPLLLPKEKTERRKAYECLDKHYWEDL